MCGIISNFSSWEMWRFLRFIHMWRNFRFLHTVNVEKYEISPHVACVWCKNVNTYAKFKLFCSALLQFMQFYRKTVVSWFTHFCVEKNLSENCISGEKMTNMRSVPSICIMYIFIPYLGSISLIKKSILLLETPC